MSRVAPIGPGIVAEVVTIPRPAGGLLYGVISRPAVMPAGPRVVIIAGRTSPGDVLRWFAESLARRGYVVLRFDPTGVADSPGGDRTTDVAIDDHYRSVQAGAFTDDTKDAVTWMERTYRPAEICLLSVCGLCSAALMAAAAMPRTISRLILLTPPVLYLGTSWTRMYVSQILASLRKFLTGRGDYAAIRRDVGLTLRTAAGVCRRAVMKRDRSPRPAHAAFNWHFWEGFCAVIARGVPILFLLAELDNETAAFNAEFRIPILERHDGYARLCTVRSLPDTDHSFMLEEGRLRALDAILRWLESVEDTTHLSAVS